MLETGHVVRELHSGSTRGFICDDYCKNKTKEEVQAILDKIAHDALRALTAAANNGEFNNYYIVDS